MRYKVFAGILFGSVLYSACANSALLEADLDSAGDRYLTIDTTTGLEWLDVTQTDGYSINDVLSDRGGWWSRGFRYATDSQVNHLYGEAGLVQGDFYGPPTPAQDFQALVGITWIVPPDTRSPDLVGALYTSAWLAPYDPQSANDYETWYQGGAVVVRPVTNDYLAVVVWTSTNDLDRADDRYAHWLVRPAVVPIPAAAWLFGSALGVMGWLRRKNAA